jgi:hypothetical protein
MATIKVSVSVGLVGCTQETEFEIDDEIFSEMSEDEIEREALEEMLDAIDWSYTVEK